MSVWLASGCKLICCVGVIVVQITIEKAGFEYFNIGDVNKFSLFFSSFLSGSADDEPV